MLVAAEIWGGEEAPRGSPVLKHLLVWVEDSCQHCPRHIPNHAPPSHGV